MPSAVDSVVIVATESGLGAKTIQSLDAAAVAGLEAALGEKTVATFDQAATSSLGIVSLSGGESTATPGVADLVLAGQAPTVALDIVVQRQPALAAVVVEGLPPATIPTARAQPAAAAVTLEGLAPTATSGTVKAGTDSAAVQAAESPLGTKTVQTADAAATSASGALAALEAEIHPPAGAVTAEGLASAALVAPSVGLAELALAGFAPSLVLETSGVLSPAYADLRLNQGDETRPTVNTLGDNAKVGTDTASIQGAEAALESKTVHTVEAAEIGAAETPVATELRVYDTARTESDGVGNLFDGISPAAAGISLQGLQPGVFQGDGTGASPNPAELVAAGQAPVVVSVRAPAPAAAAVTATGQAPTARFSQGPEPATVVVQGLTPALAFGLPVSATDTASLAGTEAALSAKTVASVDEAEIGAAATPVTTELLAYDQGRLNSADVTTPFTALQPATAIIQVLSLQPAVSVPPSISLVPETGSITLGGAQPTVALVRAVAPGVAELAAAGQAPAVKYGQNPDPATIRLRAVTPTVLIRREVNPGAAGVSIQGLRSVIFASGGWTDTGGTPGSWTDAAGASGSWTDVARESETWT